MTKTVLKAKFIDKKKRFEIEMPPNQKLEIASSGLFDNEMELEKWASENGGVALGYLDGSRKNQYILAYGMDTYDVEVEE